MQIAADPPLWLGQDDGLAWWVGDEERAAPFGATPPSLPILEMSYKEVVDALMPVERDSLAFDVVVGRALRDGGYWGALAVGWIDEGYPATGLVNALDAAWNNRSLPQSARQHAKRRSWQLKLDMVERVLRESGVFGSSTSRHAPRVLSEAVRSTASSQLADLLEHLAHEDPDNQPDRHLLEQTARDILLILESS
jgi:hypothetical protein